MKGDSMSRQSLYPPIKNAIDALVNLDYQSFKNNPGAYQPWNNLDLNDFFESYDDLISILKSATENNAFEKLPFNLLNSLSGLLTTALNSVQQLFTQKNQNVFNAALSQIETLRYNLNAWGITYLGQIGKRLSEKEKVIDEQIAKLITGTKDIDRIKQNVENLIEPAVAGSLSKSFSDRREALARRQNGWFWVSVIAALLTITATYFVVTSIVGIFSNDLVLQALKDGVNGSEKILWPTMFLRVGILFPIFSLFYYSFSRYKKERDLEEEYAHKEI